LITILECSEKSEKDIELNSARLSAKLLSSN